jgi:hypothetical protein
MRSSSVGVIFNLSLLCALVCPLSLSLKFGKDMTGGCWDILHLIFWGRLPLGSSSFFDQSSRHFRQFWPLFTFPKKNFILRSTPSGRKLSEWERKKNNAINSGHLRLPHSLSTTQDGQRMHFARTNNAINSGHYVCNASHLQCRRAAQALRLDQNYESNESARHCERFSNTRTINTIEEKCIKGSLST